MTPTAEKLNLIKQFGKVFSVKTDDATKEIPASDQKGYMDMANVCMIIPKNKDFENFIVSNFEVKEQKVPVLNYNHDLKKGMIRSKYSCEYLRILLEICKNYEHVELKINTDYPLRAETKDFIYILAPRVDND